MQIIQDRRALHQIPEVEKNLPETFAYLEHTLSKLNCQRISLGIHGLCAFFDFGREETLAFRADADALPIPEKTGAPYASRHEGKMHACGHDGHMSILLELARRLNRKKTLPHNVLLVFQAGEESPGGARDICETGIFDQYHVKAIFGLHLWPGLEKGTVFSRKRELMARASEVNVDIYGKSAHVANASKGIDSVAAGAELLRRAFEMEKALPAGTYRLLKFGIFRSGTVRNALSAHTRLEGSLRAFQDAVFDTLRDNLFQIGRDIEADFGCTVQIGLSPSYPAVINPEALYDRVSAIVPVSSLAEPCMTAEDFAWYQRFVPGMFFFLGLGGTPALHADTFDFDESVLVKGADFFETLAEAFQ